MAVAKATARLQGGAGHPQRQPHSGDRQPCLASRKDRPDETRDCAALSAVATGQRVASRVTALPV